MVPPARCQDPLPLEVILTSSDDIEVVGEARDGREAVEVVTRERPDVVLMDIRMPESDGLEATRRITADERLANTKVLILTTFDLDDYVFEALRAGASGFLLKDGLPHGLLAAVRVVARGQALLAPSVTRRLVEEFARRPAAGAGEPPPWLDTLTTRETEVLGAVARGIVRAGDARPEPDLGGQVSRLAVRRRGVARRRAAGVSDLR